MHFKTVQKFKADFCPSEFSLYESTRTGMRVVVVDQKSPKVYGYFTLATEIHDDSGAPHTLEHLVFMGSKSYRYKGLLDKLATRSYSNTNAWTATDHTAYTLETAGWEGFSQILPVYLEHVLLPTLTDAGCYTEVHHVDGTGHDAGVVYSEMQGVQNQPAELMDLRARRMLYPQTNGFRSETGGLMEQLRVLSADRIRSFHKEMYQPKNLCLILIGEIDHDNALQILEHFEDGILDDVPRLDEPFDRPWSKTGKAPLLTSSKLETIEFPEEDESMGEIIIGYLGPDVNDELLNDALTVLLTYICGSSVSLLENTLVETEQLCSAVYYSTDSRPDVMIWFNLTGVDTKLLKDVEKRFFEVLREALEKPFDMKYLLDCLQRNRRQIKFHSESSGNFFGEMIITDHLFGKRDGSTLRNTCGTMEGFDALEKWSEQEWKDFFSKWIVNANHVSVIGVPSQRLSKKLQKEETDRVKAQQEKLGEEGLKKLADQLEEAKKENDKEIPQELLQLFKIPDTSSIHFIPTTTARSGMARDMGKLSSPIQDIIDAETSDLPLFIHFEHIPTNFVHLNLFVCSQSIPVELRPLLTLFEVNFFDTPVMLDGKRVEFEDAVTLIEKDTIGYGIDSGSGVGNSELIRINVRIEPEKYQRGIEWIRDFLYHGIFDETRLKAALAKILADIPEEKRSGDSMAGSVVNMIHYSRNSTGRALNTLVKSVYLRRALALLQHTPEKILSKLEDLRKHLTDPSNFRIVVLADLESPKKLDNPVSAWKTLLSSSNSRNKDFLSSPKLRPLDSLKSVLSPAGQSPGRINYIVPMEPIDSSYGYLTTRGLDSYDHPQLPALDVALAYLNAVEGPLWVAIRGTGLAYGAFFAKNVDTGRLQFRIYRSPDTHKAYSIARKTVEDLADGRADLEQAAMEGAVSSIVVGFADEQPTMASAAMVAFANQVIKGVGKEWSTGFLKKVRNVSKDDVRKALKELVLPVFMPNRTDIIVTCATLMQEKLLENFKADGFEPEVRNLNSFQDDYDMEGEELVENMIEEVDGESESEEDAEAGEDEAD